MTTTTTNRGSYWQPKSADEKRIEKLILDTLRARGAQGWTVIFSRESARLGYCSYSTREICISRKIMGNWDQAVNTALHEVAHALTPGASHGPRWKAMAVELGASPKARAEDYIPTHQHGEIKTVRTSYGPVSVEVGQTTVSHERVGEVRVIEVLRKYFIGELADGNFVKLPLDRLHPDFGDSTKVPEKVVTVVDHRGESLEITLGKTSYTHRGVPYTAVSATRRRVKTVSAQGVPLMVPAELFRTQNKENRA